ncbi:hypothetical protein N7448_000769 [Penicillium atrosanguineum]|uniref:Uncharacterized protein n=1 Tax=Penicillium atrosanguineum TaxID=1132637 RepID=A0A9W9LCJ4_9EURO|nr:hypothetical protein N7448_000769 [Penicillium atrosanguineum]KAJ5323975.1 hypothetical protein N7476_002575 [Penicillium atrosanguineum]
MSIQEWIQRVDFYRLGSGAALLALLAFYSPVMLMVLSPTYGALPAHIFHVYGLGAFAAAGWFSKDQVQMRLGRVAAYMLPVLAFWTPTLQYFVMQQSSKLGNPLGPVITELFGYYPLAFLTVAIAGKQIQYSLHLDDMGDVAREHVPLLGSYFIYSAGEHFAKAVLSHFIGFTIFFSRAGLQFVIAVLYAAVVPSKMLLLAIPSVLFSITSDVHFGGISGVNSAIQGEGYSLLARQESYTGYISVLENHHDGFRVMRCDHSLLGGQWTKMTPGYNPEVEDPIYAVFTMLESVRLVETIHGSHRVDADSKALVIGLGVGTTPAALMKHGIDTTVVELDPVVVKFAEQYFNFPSNHAATVDDATKFVKKAMKNPAAHQYDYIVHDVFTGGAEPAELFTIDFLHDLKTLLKDDGVIAINYAGDLELYPTGLVVRTILATFPTCRVFRESEAKPDDENANFTNMVIFCTKRSTGTPLQFRAPERADFLGSNSRKNYLLPKYELDPAMFDPIPKGGRRLLVDKEVKRLYKYQDRGALEHWSIMRQVIPAAVWENW